ncbi:rhotekin-like isoform X2 [Acipenser ruthenus]|uniref:rhotekin-like isoform X2 n=1 Tax=Acipenser ruthenus TaxID=7906 RepID=UPI00145AFE8C|nr:rhotekin-like isoform X2 [Acipenser ruthenus]
MPIEKFADMEEKLRILEDLNMIYIRQIALSLQDSDIQKKIDYEIRMRDGACKLLAACSQREQALEAAKSLVTCNARIMAYMAELQKMKEAQVMQRMARRPSDSSPIDDRLPCKGKVAISDLRIPLMWKDTEYFKNKGDLHRCAVFCLLQVGAEIYDTDMVMVDRTLTDICFENGIVFSEAGPGFQLKLDLYSCCTEEEFSMGSTPKKLASKLSSSLGRSSGKKVRATLDPGGSSPVSNGGGSPLLLPAPTVPGPKYHLLAHTTLTLTSVQDSFRTHDLTISGNEESSFWLPLYGSVCCRLAAQPLCMTQQMMAGCLKFKQQVGDNPNWTKIYGVLKGTNLFCYNRAEDVEAKVEPAFTIAINKETRIRATDKDLQSGVQSISITNRYGGEEVMHTLVAENHDDTQRWMQAFWQQFYDMSLWKQCCDDLMKIEMPLPRKPPATISKQGSLYHEMVIDPSDDIGTVTDILTRRVQDFDARRNLEPPPHLVALFDGPHHRRHIVPSSSDSDSAYSTSPCSHHRPWRARPRTLSLDAKLSSLKSRGQACSEPPARPLVGLSCTNSTSTSSSSSSEGSSTPEFDSAPFSRPSPARQSLRNLRAKLDPRS